MSRNYAALPPSEVRRKDREVGDDAWIAALLNRAPMGTLATIAEGRPFINANLFVFHEAGHVIYMHTARAGRTVSNVDGGEPVCFSVSEIGRLLPADTAFSMSVEYNGVAVFGRAAIVGDEPEKRAALQMLVGKYFPHLAPERDYRVPNAEELAKTAVTRIEIDEWSGKAKVGEPEHPGAFIYGEHGETAS